MANGRRDVGGVQNKEIQNDRLSVDRHREFRMVIVKMIMSFN